MTWFKSIAGICWLFAVGCYILGYELLGDIIGFPATLSFSITIVRYLESNSELDITPLDIVKHYLDTPIDEL